MDLCKSGTLKGGRDISLCPVNHSDTRQSWGICKLVYVEEECLFPNPNPNPLNKLGCRAMWHEEQFETMQITESEKKHRLAFTLL